MREGSGNGGRVSGPAGGPVPPTTSSNNVRGPAGGPVPRPLPTPRPGPAPRHPLGRPSSRTDTGQARRYPKPQHHDDPVAGVGRVILRRMAPLLTGLVWPDPLNLGEEEWLAEERRRQQQARWLTDAPTLPAVVENGDGSVDIHPSGDVWWPRPVPVLVPPLNPDAAPEEVPHGMPASPRPRPRPVPIDDPLFRPSSRPNRQLEEQNRYLGELQVRLHQGEDGQPVIRLQQRKVTERYLFQPRHQDTKFGRKVFWVVNRVVDATYGLVSEAQDLAEVFTHSLYGPDGVPALDMYGSQVEAFRAYMEGKVRLDTVGFVVDFAINQAADFAYGIADAPMEYAQKRSAYWAPQYTAHRFRLEAGRREEWNDYVRSQVQWAESRLRSYDSQRSQRIQSLWAP